MEKSNEEILEELDINSILNVAVTMVKRARYIAKKNKEDHYIIVTPTGMEIVSETVYTDFSEKQIKEFRHFLETDKLIDFAPEKIDEEIDKFASNLVIKHIDYKTIGDNNE